MPFAGLMESPAERVAQEESAKTDRLQGRKATFSAQLMTHNIQVTVMTMAAGVTWGVGTIILLFYNGVILGAVAADYMGAGYGQFLAGWLLPHGSIEIPAILLGGQAGLMLAGALIGWGERTSRADRLRAVAHDLLAIALGAAAHAGVGRHRGSVRLAVSPAGAALRPEDCVWRFGTGGLVDLPFASGPGMTPARASALRIETPEGVVFSLRLASPVLRALAWACGRRWCWPPRPA